MNTPSPSGYASPAEACSGSALGLLFRQVRDAMWARMELELAAAGQDLTFSQFIAIKKLATGTASVNATGTAMIAPSDTAWAATSSAMMTYSATAGPGLTATAAAEGTATAAASDATATAAMAPTATFTITSTPCQAGCTQTPTP